MSDFLREATSEDCELLLQWANDPVTRGASFTSERIDYETHCRWYQNLLNDPERKQYILMCDGEPVGQIRVSVTGQQAELSYSIAPDKRGMGYGSKLLTMIKEQIVTDFPAVCKLIAQIKPDNKGSQKVVLGAGFTERMRVYETEIS